MRCGGVFFFGRSAKGCRSAAQERVISNPGRYRLCWCSDGSDCTLPSQYLSYAGILQIKWPTYSPERFFCELGQLCNISGIEGEGLGNNDKAGAQGLSSSARGRQSPKRVKLHAFWPWTMSSFQKVIALYLYAEVVSLQPA